MSQTVAFELHSFLEKTIKADQNKDRDVQIISYFFGFGTASWPTLQETGDRFGGLSRERIRQIINEKFRENSSPEDFPSAVSAANQIGSKNYWSHSGLTEELSANGLMVDGFSLKGLFNLFEDLGICHEYEIYTPNLEVATRGSIEKFEENFILRVEDVKTVRALLTRAKKLHGKIGIAKLEYLADKSPRQYGEFSELLGDLIKNLPEAWTLRNEDDFWYLFDGMDNTLVNYSEKVFSVVEYCEQEVLAETYAYALRARTNNHPYPPREIISKYLGSSIYFENNEGILSFLGQRTQPSPIELDIFRFLPAHPRATYQVLKEYLLALGYGDANIKKTVPNSPFVHVDRSGGRRNFRYSFVGKIDISADELDYNRARYRVYVRKLRELEIIGTDQTVEQKRRREQHILKDWLFKDKETENCAICGKKFNVSSLVTAHKKKRAQCRAEERLDPYVVFPVCKLGCDYMYENRLVYIDSGIVKKGVPLQLTQAEAGFVDSLIGNRLEQRWLGGPAEYFQSDFERE